MLSSVDRFNLQTKKWEQLPKMNVARKQPGAAAINGDVYVFCGENPGAIHNSIEKLSNAAGIRN